MSLATAMAVHGVAICTESSSSIARRRRPQWRDRSAARRPARSRKFRRGLRGDFGDAIGAGTVVGAREDRFAAEGLDGALNALIVGGHHDSRDASRFAERARPRAGSSVLPAICARAFPENVRRHSAPESRPKRFLRTMRSLGFADFRPQRILTRSARPSANALLRS